MAFAWVGVSLGFISGFSLELRPVSIKAGYKPNRLAALPQYPRATFDERHLRAATGVEMGAPKWGRGADRHAQTGPS